MRLGFQIYRLTEILSEQRAATRENVERKLARTETEREESDEEASDDDANQVSFFLSRVFSQQRDARRAPDFAFHSTWHTLILLTIF